jgi:hypothetical protein
MSSWPKIIRDPVHDIIPFEDTHCDRLLLDLINTREFQRLRRIKQLGMSQYVFPGADHSRFAHSIGVMNNARRLLERLALLAPPADLDDDRRTVVLVASLLHDVGHGPFSHTFEKIAGESHETRTLDIIRDESTKVNEVLRRAHVADLPQRLEVFFDEDLSEDAVEAADIPKWLTQVVSSQLDADRFDYLRRDSHATGTDYGNFDQEWLVHHIELDTTRKRFFLSRKALAAAEGYVFARYHMYRSVYFHKTTRAAEVMLRLLLSRYRALMDAEAEKSRKTHIVEGAPVEVFQAFSQPMTLGEYLALDDHSMTGFFKACAKARDPWLNRLGSGLLNRTLYKAVDMTGFDPADVERFKVQAIRSVTEAGLDPAMAFADDSPSDTPYRPYDPDRDNPATQIYVQMPEGRAKELSEVSQPVRQLTSTYHLRRYYFPEDIRDRIAAVADCIT